MQPNLVPPGLPQEYFLETVFPGRDYDGIQFASVNRWPRLTTGALCILGKVCQKRVESINTLTVLVLVTDQRKHFHAELKLFELLWKAVNFRSGLVYVLKSKVGKARYIPMNESLRNALKDLPSRFRGDYVFPSPKTAGKLDNVKKQFASAVVRAGIENPEEVTPYTLRHTFASHLAMSGVDLKTIAELLGHSSTRMTERYAHLSPSHKTRAIKILDSALQTDTKTDTAASGWNQRSV